MFSGFGLYITTVGIALVFTLLLTIWLMIEVSKRLFIEKKALTKKDIKLAKVAAIAAVLVSTKDNRIYQITKAEGTGRWRAIAKIEALNRRLFEE